MFKSISVDDALAHNAISHYPSGSSAVDLIGRRDTDGDGPLAFMVSAPAASQLKAHFHPTDQFQVFVDGPAMFGRHPVRVGSVHYSDAYAPYGPITATETNGYGYLTLRPQSTMEVHWVPEEIGLAKGRKAENVSAESATPDGRKPGLHELFSRQDGVRASEFVAAAGEVIPGLNGRGYYVVMDGGVECAGCGHPFRSCFWTDGADEPELKAGGAGATVLLLRFAHAA